MRLIYLTALLLVLLLADLSLAQRGRGRGRGPGRGLGDIVGRGQFRGRGRGPQNDNSSEDSQSSECQTAKGEAGTCEPLSHCVYQFNGADEIPRSRCGRGNKVCCPVETPPTGEWSPVRRPASVAGRRVVSLPEITQEDLDIAGRASLTIVRGIDDAERSLLNDGIFAKRKSTAAQQSAFFGFKLIVQALGRDGLIGLEATRELARRFNLDSLQGRDGLQRFNIQNTVIADTCPEIPRCPSTKFRSIDGLCNNLENREWGKSLTAYERFLPPSYADGLTLPRVSIDGGPLPSARKVSATLMPDADVPNQQHTLMLMQFGQFIDHDLTLTGVTRFSNGSAITCCDPQLAANPTRRHFACMQIDIAPDDQFYGQFQQNCLEFVRSVAAPRPKCKFGPREQLNQLTAYLDGSAIYGSTEEEAKALRSMTDGRMETTVFSKDEMLPLQPEGVHACIIDGACFRGGDARVNEQVGLTAMHTLWMREHNRVAGELKRLNPGWKDEILYQEARRIVAAEFQHITYNEYLPLLLGRQIMTEFDLLLTPRGYSNSYDPELNAGIGNVFAAASYRYGHTLVQVSQLALSLSF